MAAVLFSVPAFADSLYFMKPGGAYEIKASGVSLTIIVKKISGEWVRAEVLQTKKTIWVNMGMVATVEEVARHEAKP